MRSERTVWWIDPDSGGFERWLRRPIDKALRVHLDGVIEDHLAGSVDFIGLTVMNLVGRIKPMLR